MKLTHLHVLSAGRSFVRWTEHENELIAEYFQDWIQGHLKGGPGMCP
jgi:hypothetical protein